MTTPNQKRASRHRTETARWFHLDKPPVERIRLHLEKLSMSTTPLTERMRLWRMIQQIALDAHDLEVRQLDALNAVHSDPAFTSAVGAIVE